MQIISGFTPKEKSHFRDPGVVFPGLNSPASAVYRSPRHPVIYSVNFVFFFERKRKYER